MKALAASILTASLMLGCATEDESSLGSTEQNVSSYVAATVSATTTFTTAVATNTRNEAGSFGITLPGTVKTGYSTRNTIGVATGASTVFLVTTAFRGGRYKPGFYQIGNTSHGPTLYYFTPTGKVPLGLSGTGAPPSSVVGGDLCAGSGVAYDFCTRFVSCALDDIDCPDLPCCTEVG